MRVNASRARRVRSGDIVKITSRLAGDSKYVKLSLWSKHRGYEYSPHVQVSRIGLVVDDKPSMVQPTFFTLMHPRPEKSIQFVAEEDLILVVKQEKDLADKDTARVKIKRYGKVAQWFMKNFPRLNFNRIPLGANDYAKTS